MPYNWEFSDDSTSQFMPYKLLFVCLGNICRSPACREYHELSD
jgi:protein-tyrosine phosphatase